MILTKYGTNIMIGQLKLKNTFTDLIQNNLLPRFNILVGVDGSGKNMLAYYHIAKQLDCDIVLVNDLKASSLKEIINQSYQLMDTTVYIIRDADDMSLAARNSLLKVLEEPPNKAIWILTVDNIDNVLPTIRSRGSIYYLDPYTKDELAAYASNYKLSDNEMNIVLKIAEVPGDINLLVRSGVDDLYNWVSIVVDNIEKVSGANAFKIGDKISLKKDSEGYDLSLFWKTFRAICFDRVLTNLKNYEMVLKYSDGVAITGLYMNELGITGINKISLFDAWLLDIRKAWL